MSAEEDPLLAAAPVKPGQVSIGLRVQYLAVGIVYGGLPATIYPFFLNYLNVPGYVYNTAGTLILMPWSVKVFLGLLNDCVPICGYRRKPYMALGWCMCCIALLFLSCVPIPAPYWCVGRDGQYNTTIQLDGKTAANRACNPSAQDEGGKYAIHMMMATFGYVVADVAADGLTVTLAKMEPESQRGTTQATVYFMRTLGQCLGVGLVGLGMNTPEYGGTWSWGISFDRIAWILALVAATMAPFSWVMAPDVPVGSGDRPSFRQYLSQVWELLESDAMLAVVLYQFLSGLIGSISSTSGSDVQRYWAHVENLPYQVANIVSLALFALGLDLVRRYFLSASWRAVVLVTTVFVNVVDMPFSFCTIYNVVRNQFFFLGESFVVQIPLAAGFVITTFVIVEMAGEGQEGLVFGLLTTISNLGSPVGQAISNDLFGSFRPSLSNSSNYIDDTPEFRNTVAEATVLSYCFSFASLAVLPLLPQQKRDAQRRLRLGGSSRRNAYMSIGLLTVGLLYSTTVNFLSMFKSTMCLRIAGGSGC